MQKLSAQTNALNWFEIPAIDIARAKNFYETIFETQLFEMEMMGMKMAVFPSQSPLVGGGLAQSPNHKPSTEGSIVYLNANPDLQIVLDKVIDAGGMLTMPKTNIGDNGFMAFFIDTEGNSVGVHSMT
ncbi:lactoylglutathione lyase [Pedobacter psychrophilus]|uniref:Lactoylglutathione lyase n=1 Tax=Pedobacter psychrophilus TaxID=1826909 RepID=A0A179DKR5_9SPHI|nr:VOC family protein [Pedobacter psychrophilus]OAQ41706.1 lactoylglutathione lyase [Pedobacter psychrophilus]